MLFMTYPKPAPGAGKAHMSTGFRFIRNLGEEHNLKRLLKTADRWAKKSIRRKEDLKWRLKLRRTKARLRTRSTSIN